jgi:hypothetical protein
MVFGVAPTRPVDPDRTEDHHDPGQQGRLTNPHLSRTLQQTRTPRACPIGCVSERGLLIRG